MASGDDHVRRRAAQKADEAGAPEVVVGIGFGVALLIALWIGLSLR